MLVCILEKEDAYERLLLYFMNMVKVAPIFKFPNDFTIVLQCQNTYQTFIRIFMLFFDYNYNYFFVYNAGVISKCLITNNTRDAVIRQFHKIAIG